MEGNPFHPAAVFSAQQARRGCPDYTGPGRNGRLLLIKDSYGNSFAQFPAKDYAEVHVLDLRFFKGDVTEYARENGITDALVLYGTQNFVKDTNLTF